MGSLFARALLLTAVFFLLIGPELANAIDLELADGELSGSFDTTITLGGSVRTEDADADIIGVQNGGSANSINGDDGNLNFKSGDFTSAVAKITQELELSYLDFGLFTRYLYFYDLAIMEQNTERTDFSNSAERLIGNDFQMLDAYLTYDLKFGDTALTIRGGNQVISWGESTFIQNGINTINPIDVSKFRVAGAELRDGLIPEPMLDINLSVNDRLSVEGFYQFLFDNTEIEPKGTFFSTNDFASPGGEFVLLGFGQPPIPDNPPLFGINAPVGVTVPRGSERFAKDAGQFGVAIRYFAPELNDTEFGLYWTHLHSRLPLISAHTGTLAGVGAGDYAASARYFREFPEDIDTAGLGFNTEIGSSGIALQGEFSYRFNQPLQVDDVELLFAALSPLNPAVFGQSQLGAAGFDQEIRGYKRKDMMQAQITVTQLTGPMLGADQLVLIGEAGLTHILDFEDKKDLRYEAAGTYTSGNPFFTDAGIQPPAERGGAFPDAFSWGYRARVRADYNNAIGAVNLLPQVAFSHDVNGTTPSPITNFVQDRKTVTLSVAANYLTSYTAQIAYTFFFDGGRYNLLKDRDFVSAAIGYSF